MLALVLPLAPQPQVLAPVPLAPPRAARLAAGALARVGAELARRLRGVLVVQHKGERLPARAVRRMSQSLVPPHQTLAALAVLPATRYLPYPIHSCACQPCAWIHPLPFPTQSAAKANDAAATMDGDWDNDDADEWGTTTNVAFRSRGRAQVGESQDVSLHSFQLSVKGKDLLVGTKLLLHKGHRYGLVGRNGVGKSTLLRRMARYQIAGFPTHLRTLHVKQEVVGTDCKVLDAMLSADTERAALLAEEDALLASAADDQPERLIEIYERLAELDADSAEDRARKILRGLQFTDEMMVSSVTSSLPSPWTTHTHSHSQWRVTTVVANQAAVWWLAHAPGSCTRFVRAP